MTLLFRAALACLLLGGGGAACRAAEIKVLTAGAFKSVLTALVPGFTERTGHRVVLDNDTAGALARRIGAGEAFDLVVLTPEALEGLARSGALAAAAPVRLARVGIGVAVRAGAPAPAIGTVAEFRQAVLAARAVAFIDPAAGGSSGIYLARLFETLGIADPVKAKAVLVPGGLVATRVVDGSADLVIHQISEILAVPGATLIGPLPPNIQQYTTYAGAVGAAARDPSAAASLLAALAAPEAQSILRDKGMDRP